MTKEQGKAEVIDLHRAGYDLKAVNQNRRHATDDRSPLEIVAEIGVRGAEVAAAVARLRALLQG